MKLPPEPLKRFKRGCNKMAWIFYVATALWASFVCSATFSIDVSGREPARAARLHRLAFPVSEGIIHQPRIRWIFQPCWVETTSGGAGSYPTLANAGRNLLCSTRRRWWNPSLRSERAALFHVIQMTDSYNRPDSEKRDVLTETRVAAMMP